LCLQQKQLRWHRGDIRNILSIMCARDGGHQKYFIYYVRKRWGTSEMLYQSRAHAMGDIRNILSITCARDGGHLKYFIYYVRSWLWTVEVIWYFGSNNTKALYRFDLYWLSIQCVQNLNCYSNISTITTYVRIDVDVK
jgi:hypothetical protein